MNFTVTYRSANGARSVETVAAASRADVFAQMKSRGISPLSVVEDKRTSRPKNPAASSVGKRSVMRGIVAGLFVVATATTAWLLISSPEKPTSKPVSTPKVQKTKIQKPNTDIKSDPRSTKPRTEVASPSVVEEKKPAYDPDFQANYPRKPGHLPLPGGNVVTFAPPAPGTTAQVFTVNGLYLCDSEGNFTKYEPPRLFDNRFENTLESLAMNTRLLLTDHTKQFSDDEIVTYLSRPITINPDDPPDIVERKTATAAMKEEIKAYIKNGGTYQDYIDELHNKVSNERSLHREAMREMVNLLAEGDIEGARLYRDKVNEYFTSEGYFGLKLPEEWQRKLDGKPEPDEDTGNSLKKENEQ